jgi:hypothetical protein
MPTSDTGMGASLGDRMDGVGRAIENQVQTVRQEIESVGNPAAARPFYFVPNADGDDFCCL